MTQDAPVQIKRARVESSTSYLTKRQLCCRQYWVGCCRDAHKKG